MHKSATHSGSRSGVGSLYATFFATGIAVALPGAILPLFLVKWALRDQQAGVLFFCFFVSSSAGALLSRGQLPRSIARGCAAAALGAGALSVASRSSVFAAMLLYGVGLGIAMTSISLLQSRRHPHDRPAEMARLNLIWALGACVGPWFTLRGAALFGAPHVLLAVSGVFVLLGMLSLLSAPHAMEVTEAGISPVKRSFHVPLLLALAVPLATGVEAAMGGWLTTYSARYGNSLNLVIGAVTCFWMGMLASRFAQSNQRVSAALSRPFLVLGPAVMVCGMGFVLMSHGVLVLAGALLLGLGVGPMFPLLLALALARGEKNNIIFVIAGCGASLLPFLTGVVSGRMNSLRAGLGVPLAGALLMLLSGFALRSQGPSVHIGEPLSIDN